MKRNLLHLCAWIVAHEVHIQETRNIKNPGGLDETRAYRIAKLAGSKFFLNIVADNGCVVGRLGSVFVAALYRMFMKILCVLWTSRARNGKIFAKISRLCTTKR